MRKRPAECSIAARSMGAVRLHYNEWVGSRTGRSLLKDRGKSELRRAVCRITSGRALALLWAGSFDGKCHRKHTARAARLR